MGIVTTQLSSFPELPKERFLYGMQSDIIFLKMELAHVVISGDGSLDGAHDIKTRSIMQVPNLRNFIVDNLVEVTVLCIQP